MAYRFKEWVVKAYDLTNDHVFLSSSPDSIKGNEFFQTVITNSMRTAAIMIVLLSRSSMLKPWVLFEAGAGFARNILLSPILCKHASVSDMDSRSPLANIQAKDASDAKELSAFLCELDNALNRKHNKSCEESLRLLLCDEKHQANKHHTDKIVRRTMDVIKIKRGDPHLFAR